MKRIGIIQLSDLQFGKKHIFGTPSTIVRKLVSDIGSLAQKHSFSPMYLLASGDIAETAHTEEYKDAEKQITQIADDLSIDRDAVLLIPGNHDISWPLSRAAEETGDPSLKLATYSKFVMSVNRRCRSTSDRYPAIMDRRAGVVFALIDTCEHETHTIHKGWVNADRLIKTLSEIDGSLDGSTLTKICVMHHRLTAIGADGKACVENARDVEAILRGHKIDIVLTGHAHEATICSEVKDGHSITYTGVGSTSVDQTQRGDGVQNQYCVHILDRETDECETIWRSYNPSRATPLGIGGWVSDNSVSEEKSRFSLPAIKAEALLSKDLLQDGRLKSRLGVGRNPFVFSNAEKISPDLILELFVSDEARHKGAKRLTGDAIIRGSRGAGKTMLLRYLDLYGAQQFRGAINRRETAECFPVMINFSVVHPAEINRDKGRIYDVADALIYRSVLSALDKAAEELRKPAFKDAVYRAKQRIDSLKNVDLTLISKLGVAIKEYLGSYFKHILLLIDEIAPVFPREFFDDTERGFLYWMNSIRNSGPFYTRVAVYPNAISDILNEERFGSLVNLDFNIHNSDEYRAFHEYCSDLVNRYLASVSCSETAPAKMTDLIASVTDPSADPFEQLIYASDGSPRRFLSLMDKCFNAVASSPGDGKAVPLTKEAAWEVIKEYSRNLVNSYSVSEQEMAASIAKACKKQVTFRFRAPGLTPLLYSLHSAREESNVVKLAEVGAGRRGSIYEFAYPYCVLMDIQTHFLKDSRRVCNSRDRIDGEWISIVTTIQKDQIESLVGLQRLNGEIAQYDGEKAIIKCADGRELWCDELPAGSHEGSQVSFLENANVAVDVAIVE